jgi:prolyl-tRNA editing enzyme YbaK/EbsC (Cys-tRNA(Pro) deacylase)
MDGHHRWLAACATLNLTPEVASYPAGTATSADAAAALGCTVEQIAKSVVFVGANGPVVVIASGADRIDRKKRLRDVLGAKPGMADAAYVEEQVGYRVGGVPPFGHLGEPIVLMDAALLEHDEVWAAAGSSTTVFRIAPEDLARLAGAHVCDVREVRP